MPVVAAVNRSMQDWVPMPLCKHLQAMGMTMATFKENKKQNCHCFAEEGIMPVVTAVNRSMQYWVPLPLCKHLQAMGMTIATFKEN